LQIDRAGGEQIVSTVASLGAADENIKNRQMLRCHDGYRDAAIVEYSRLFNGLGFKSVFGPEKLHSHAMNPDMLAFNVIVACARPIINAAQIYQ
jgi:hypothetical protein